MRIFSSLKAWLGFAAPYMPGYSNGLVDTQLLVGLGIQPIPKNRVAPRLVLWHPPIFPWIKLNIDGLAKGNPGPAACGGVFRDTHGHYTGGYCQGLGHKSAFYSELMGMIIGIEYVFQDGWRCLWLECDSTSVIACIKSSSFVPPWPLRIAWLICLARIREMTFHCSHILREGNMAADRMANMGFLSPSLGLFGLITKLGADGFSWQIAQFLFFLPLFCFASCLIIWKLGKFKVLLQFFHFLLSFFLAFGDMKRIYDFGVKKILVTNLAPMGRLPRITSVSSFKYCNETLNSLVRSQNLLLQQAVAKLNIETESSSFIVLDHYALFMSVFKNKGRDGNGAGWGWGLYSQYHPHPQGEATRMASINEEWADVDGVAWHKWVPRSCVSKANLRVAYGEVPKTFWRLNSNWWLKSMWVLKSRALGVQNEYECFLDLDSFMDQTNELYLYGVSHLGSRRIVSSNNPFVLYVLWCVYVVY
ncbi:putative ribonuclease H-like domain, SGNH hydrolase-type esterase domain-containing protein [Rosa chinensis]|uniref:Putative ribonuclease H-like domain, SGNH hydrolase-type esterase domain-containing protein n=1 Tax=Rosa chinensis TaxID=74649 RepID=A0A2P6RBP8_ROSCH|nr:putative ribonuclease H-like domain, SGNH hydrolase-type esterase domain-containing protein [Rosa chinensis]